MKNYSDSRINNSFRNSAFGIGGYIFTILTSFIVRTVFIKTLSSEYLGVNGLFTNILSILSLAELGIGNAIIYYLYKPLAENDEKKINELMSFFKSTYYVIAGIVGIIGLALLPFLDVFIKEPPRIQEDLQIIYVLYLLNSVVSYLMIYKKSLIVADQKEYLITIVGYVYTIIMSAAQIAILLLTKNFLLFLIVQIASSILQNIAISMICDKKYKYLKDNHGKLPQEEKKSIYRDVRALAIYRIASIVVNSTDNLILARFVGIISVGLYSNYYLIIHSVYTLIRRSLVAFSASIGNLNVTGSIEKKSLVYRTVNFIASWLFGLASICLFVLLNPFIEWWAGSEYLLDKSVVIILVINFYLLGVSGIFNVLRNTFGLFVEGQLRPLISSIINIFLSLLLVRYYGIIGVFLGTMTAYLSINIWYDPYIVHKYGLKQSVKPFYLRSLLYVLVILMNAVILDFAFQYFDTVNPIVDMLFKLGMCLLISNIIFFIAYWHTEEFKYLITIIQTKVLRKNK